MDGIADYTFERALGDVAHGRLYLAPRPARLAGAASHVVVKVVLGATADAFRRFSRELQAYASVQSPYLVQLLDAGQQADVFFSVREYLEVGTLESPTRELTRPERLRAVRHAALAAHALHETGLAHRDIRPASIWLHADGAKLGDLGLAQAVDGGAQVTTMVAKPVAMPYLDPSSFGSAVATRAADVYALGVTLHTALCGETVFGALPDDLILAYNRVLRSEPTISTDLSPEEAAVVRDCIARDLENRLQTAETVADRIQQLGAAA